MSVYACVCVCVCFGGMRVADFKVCLLKIKRNCLLSRESNVKSFCFFDSHEKCESM